MKSILSIVVMALVVVFLPACQGKQSANEVSKTYACGHCGEQKGSDKCCKHEGRKDCSKCGLMKGSMACCKIKKGEDVLWCKKCNDVKKDGCCKSAKACGGCGGSCGGETKKSEKDGSHSHKEGSHSHDDHKHEDGSHKH